MKNSWLSSPNVNGMAISIGLHLFVVGLAYYIQPTSAPGAANGQTYRVALQPISTYAAAKHHPSQNRSQKKTQVVRPVATEIDKTSKGKLKNKYFRPKQQHQKQSSSASVPQKNATPHEAPKIDERGLYNRGKHCAKQAGATLELKGWEWDTVPDPKDTTEECGKIVFEIKVDQDGEIIGIQTIEKTVTPMVEKIYADALRALTFSKTAETPYSISTGKVTFVIVAK